MMLTTRSGIMTTGDTNKYMIRKTPKEPRFKEVFGHYRLAYGEATFKEAIINPEEDEEDV